MGPFSTYSSNEGSRFHLGPMPRAHGLDGWIEGVQGFCSIAIILMVLAVYLILGYLDPKEQLRNRGPKHDVDVGCPSSILGIVNPSLDTIGVRGPMESI